MQETNLLASVALFSELFDSGHDIYDVIAEFIKTAAVSEAKWSFSATDATQLLEKTFDFKIPEAVVGTTIKNRLRKHGLVSFDSVSKLYTFTEVPKGQLLTQGFEEQKESNARILTSLAQYYATKMAIVLSTDDKAHLQQEFNSYLLGNGTSDKHSQIISSFIIENQNTPHFTERLNIIKEGLIIYMGVRYTPDLSDLHTWPCDLTLFLDTEYIFNFAGYNGSVYKDIFMDFHQLVLDINRHSTKKSGKKKIDLRYFSETKRQIEDFFHVAGLIIQRKATLDPSKNAMREIINGCKTPSDVILKKNKLFEDLKSYNIYLEEHHDYYKTHAFVIEDPSVISALKKSTEDNHRVFYSEEARQVLSLFTKINVLRKGVNNIGLERIGYIFLTGTKASLLWAHNNLIKQNDKDIPFANSMDFITDKFWFKLKKGLNEKKALPKSQDIITRAQMVLASQLNNSISRRYNELTQKAKQGVLTQPEAIATYAELRELVVNPEDITPEFIDESLAFLNDDNVERFLHERSFLLKKVKEGEEAIKVLIKIKAAQDQQDRRPKKRQAKVYYLFLSSSILLAIIAIPIFLWLFIKNFTSTQDTTIGIAGFVLAVLIEFIAIIKTAKSLHKKLKRKTRLLYLRRIEPLQ